MSVSGSTKPIYFYNVFWGKVHRESFLRECASSLLAPNNLPILKKNPNNRYIIATTQEDWKSIMNDEIFIQLNQYIQTQFVEMPTDEKTKLNSPLLYMSAGHRLLTEIMFNKQVWGVQTTPDSIFNNGFVEYITKQIEQGKMLALCPVSRFEKEGVNSALNAGNWRQGSVLNLPSRDAVRIGLDNMHSECLAANFDCNYFWGSPVYTWWKVAGEKGLIMHSMSWSPILMPYFALQHHDDSSLQQWTIDGNYVYSNFYRHKDKIAIADDSDDAFILSVSPKGQAPVPNNKQGILFSSRIVKCGLIRRLYFDDKVIDELKREIYLRPIKWHSGSINDQAWKARLSQVSDVIEFSVSRYNVKLSGYSEIENFYKKQLRRIDAGTVSKHSSFIATLIMTSVRRVRLGSLAWYRGFYWRVEHIFSVIPLTIIKIAANIWQRAIFQWPIIATKATMGNKFYQYRVNRRMRSTYPMSLWFLHRAYWKQRQEERADVIKSYVAEEDHEEIDYSRQSDVGAIRDKKVEDIKEIPAVDEKKNI